MFGVLRLRRNGLAPEQRLHYHAAFCASCAAMKEVGGRLSSLLTNYDQTALTLLYATMQRERELVDVPCTALPFRKVAMQPLDDRGRRLLAACNLLAVEAKLQDDVDDDGGWVRRGARRAVHGRARRAERQLREIGFPVACFLDLPTRQAAVEARAAPRLDELAAPTATMTATVCAWLADAAGRSDCVDPARSFGAALGRFVYVFDAWQDRRDDTRHGRFNAVHAVFGAGAPPRPVRARLDAELATCADALAELPATPYRELLFHLVDSLGQRVAAAVPGGSSTAHERDRVRETRSAEAGDCDCCGAACCEGGCCEVGCGGGAAESTSCCFTEGIVACLDCCCFWTDGSKRRRADRNRAKQPGR